MKIPIFALTVRNQDDILVARQKSRQIADLLKFENQDRTRIAAAVSEVSREILGHTKGGKIEFFIHQNDVTEFVVIVRPNDSEKFRRLLGEPSSLTEPSAAISNARRLMDYFRLAEDSVFVFGKYLPHSVSIVAFQQALLKQPLQQHPDQQQELEEMHQELLRTLETCRKQQHELRSVNLELEETNRGVVALYKELDEKAESLKKADQIKSRFLSYMSHEFRTPLNSIMGLSRMLLDHTDGDLTPEQEKQVRFITGAAQGLTELVNDLLDIAKIEAGKTEVHPVRFHVSDVFSTLRGMFRPLVTNPAVSLKFSDPVSIPNLYTDEGKVSQILRNYISNALKFTEEGEVFVAAEIDRAGWNIIFSVADTGIGISLEQQDNLFREFTQFGTNQSKTKGTGLGLALCRKLSELMGGRVWMSSEPGIGSTFYAEIPIIYGTLPKEHASVLPSHPKILIVDDDEVWRYLMKGWFSDRTFLLIEAANGIEGLKIAEEQRPDLILLDLNMPEFSGFDFLRSLKSNPAMAHIPVVINTSKILEKDEEDYLRANAVTIISKEGLSGEEAFRRIAPFISKKGEPS